MHIYLSFIIALGAAVTCVAQTSQYAVDFTRFRESLTEANEFSYVLEATVTVEGRRSETETLRVDGAGGRRRLVSDQMTIVQEGNLVVATVPDRRTLFVGYDTTFASFTVPAGLGLILDDLREYGGLTAETETDRLYKYVFAEDYEYKSYEARFDKCGGFFSSLELVYTDPNRGRLSMTTSPLANTADIAELTEYFEASQLDTLRLSRQYADYEIISTRPNSVSPFVEK